VVDQHTRKGLTLALGLGCGIGLMAGAVLWSMGDNPRLTDEQVIARARTLGMTRATELPGAKVTVLVKADTTLADLAAMLKAAGAVADSDAFLAKVKSKHPEGKPKPGIHVIIAGDSPETLADALVAEP